MKKIRCFLMVLMVGMLAPQTAMADEDAEYQYCFLPEKDGFMQPYVGDCMPFYEDGVYYIYYLKEGGDSFRHSIYLTTTTDFLNYTEYDEAILTASEEDGAQDEWTGTGSVVKVADSYYLFYTGHTDTPKSGFNETVMLAKGDSLTSFEKVADWQILPDETLGQNRDFRDPQGYVDEETGNLIFTITASQDGIARILKYTVSPDFSDITYDGIIYTDPIGKVYNLECSDTFKIGDYYYLTFSAQDDTLWYASSTEPYGPYGEQKRLDGPLFYAAKHVESADGMYMVGWARKSSSESATNVMMEWGGNLCVQQLRQKEDGSLVLSPVTAIENVYAENAESAAKVETVTVESTDDTKVYEEIGNDSDHLLLKGTFTYEGEGSFGLAFDFKDDEEDYKLITIKPQEQKLSLEFKGGKRLIAETDVALTEGETYSFTYIQENSLGTFYIDNEAALTVRLYRVADKPLRVFAENAKVVFAEISMQ